jgi:type I restriction enzyme M protein
VIFIDARKLGSMVNRTQKELTPDDISRIAGTYHAWRGEGGDYSDVPGFCKSAMIDEIRQHGHVLTPGRYVGAQDGEDDGEGFDERMSLLVRELSEQRAKSVELDAAVSASLREVGYAF